MQFEIQFIVILLIILMLILVISAVTAKIRQQAKAVLQQESQVTMLYHLSKDLAAADSFDEVLNVIRINVGKILNCQVAVFLYAENELELKAYDATFPINQEENAAALWSYENDINVGFGTNLLKGSQAQYLPLKTSQGVFGVMGVLFNEKSFINEAHNNYILSALVNQASIAIQRTKLAEVSRQIDLMRETEKLQTALLNSISHDLRTPLVSIMGVLDNLLHDFSSLDQQTREELLATAYEDADHLNRLVTNLLDMTRLEAKALKMHIEPCELRDVIGASLQPLKDEIRKRDISIYIPEDFPDVPMDFILMMRVFINLVDNALKYSKENSKIKITAQYFKEKIRVDIKDEGSGIPKDDLVKVFDKFYRAVNPKQVTGTGLGLSICKGIVEVHGGQIFAKNNPDKGVTVSVILPLTNAEVLVHEH